MEMRKLVVDSNISIAAINNGYPRVRSNMAYIPALGPKGLLIAIGGATSSSTGLNLGRDPH